MSNPLDLISEQCPKGFKYLTVAEKAKVLNLLVLTIPESDLSMKDLVDYFYE